MWSAGTVLLCRTDPAVAPRIRSVNAISVSGSVRLDGVGVRTTQWGEQGTPSDPDTHLVGTVMGVPAGLRSPDGYVVPTTCENTAEPVGEIVVTLTKTSVEGGQLDGLR